MKRILIVSSRELCYYSGSFFLGQMACELERLGAEAVFLELEENGSNFDDLEQYLRNDFHGVVDINSKLPYFVLEDGSPFLDALGVPFFNYILDHPLYHHPGLVFPLKNYHAIAIDGAHQAYMRKWYPHLRTVERLTVAGTPAVNGRPWEQREIQLLFSGTYERESKYEEILRFMGSETASLGRNIRDLMAVPGHVPIEEAAEQILKREYGWEEDAQTKEEQRMFFDRFGCRDFPELMNHLYPVDKILRNAIRRSVLEGIAATGYPLTIMGEGWEETELSEYQHIKFLPSCTIAVSFERIAQAKCVLDINPLFSMGIHDRVTTALANGCLCLTNQNPAAEDALRDGSSCLYYDENHVEELIMRLRGMSCEQMQSVGEAGHRVYLDRYTWEEHARRILAMIP